MSTNSPAATPPTTPPVTKRGLPLNVDPTHKMLHRVRTQELELYKEEYVKKVVAVCGKTWAPIFPVKRMQNEETCPVCFPVERHRYSIAK